jgi:LruC domain-containing protein
MKTKIITILMVMAFSVFSYAQNTIYVSPGGSETWPFDNLSKAFTTLQHAINFASNGDLVLVDDGTYVVSTSTSIMAAITVRSINGNAAVTVDGDNNTRCFEINHSGAVLDGFTLTNGRRVSSSGYGGGVNIVNGGTVQNCIIENSTARDGGGVAIHNSGYLLNSIVRNNTAEYGSTGYGGGVRLFNGGEVRNCVIYGNYSKKYGGGINIYKDGKVIDCTVYDNTSHYDGGGINIIKDGEVSNCTIYDNNANHYGGGINIDKNGTVQNCIIEGCLAKDGGGVAISTNGFLFNSTIRNNTANIGGNGYGGGVRLLNGGEVRNCLIYGNESIKYGGGVNIWSAGTVYNSTIVDNTAPQGAGIRTKGNSTVKNCIIYFNNGLNWQVSGSSYLYKNCNTTPTQGAACVTDDPLFVNAGINNYHLNSGSPIKDMGYDLGWMAGTFDLDGNNRIIDGTVDIGCYEMPTATLPDGDGDGIPDAQDDFPTDPNAAFLNYFPSVGIGSLAFEDLWPGKGDYDFNDLVIDYRFATVTNANNKVYYITATFEVKASGAFLRNGFGFNLPDANTALNTDLTVTGYDLQEGFITLETNGLEAGQAFPTAILFDDVFNILELTGQSIGVNTEETAPFVPYETMTLTLTPTPDTYTENDFSLVTWNPFIFVDHERNHEIHLPNHAPTSLADFLIFGTWGDNSIPSLGRYYKTATNLPWAINIVSGFDWPKEKKEINQAYNFFIEWAESGGDSHTDWYEDNAGNRNDLYIYTPVP